MRVHPGGFGTGGNGGSLTSGWSGGDTWRGAGGSGGGGGSCYAYCEDMREYHPNDGMLGADYLFVNVNKTNGVKGGDGKISISAK